MDDELADRLWKQCSSCNALEESAGKLKEDPDDWGVYYCTACWAEWQKPTTRRASDAFTAAAVDQGRKSLKERLAGLGGAQGQPEQARLERFLVMNDFLKSPDQGVRFYDSPNLRNASAYATAVFGEIVTGVRQSADWIKVGHLFLPVKLDGKFVLSLQQDLADDSGEEELGDGTEGVHPALQDFAYVQRKKQEQARSKGKPEQLSHKRPAQVPVGKPGTGALYQVVAPKIAVHEEPVVVMSMQGNQGALNHISQGALVELFDWDVSLQWRAARYAMFQGWVRLDDERQGPLLRPVNFQHPCKQPVVPMCMSVFEDNLDHLLQFIEDGFDLNVRDESGYTPLMLAAHWGRTDCCVLLLHAGASAKLKCPAGGTAAEIAGERPVGILIQALAGKKMLSVARLIGVVSELRPEVQALAESMFDQVALAEGGKSYTQKMQNWENASLEPPEDAGGQGKPEKADTARAAPEKTASGLDPLCHAVFENSLGDVRDVIESGRFEVNIREKIYGRTPLMLAAQWKRLDICVLLLQKRADARMTSPEGMCALELAKDGPTKALLKALTGEEAFVLQDLDAATSKLEPDMLSVAEAMLEDIAEEQATLRLEAMKRTKDKIKGLTAWVVDLQLEQYLEKIQSWCHAMGARSLDEIKLNWQELADDLELKPLEWKRLRADVKKSMPPSAPE
mmetsp:Transcript_26519/g.74888  ORF Transcript_26519/g.74888 Transcript_26519/m.74888 type:complete len:680 (-) Transcript_26519:42-2081(-)